MCWWMGLCCAARLLRRKALMEGTEAYFDVTDRKSSSFIIDIAKSKTRNDRLQEVIAMLFTDYRHGLYCLILLYCTLTFSCNSDYKFRVVVLAVLSNDLPIYPADTCDNLVEYVWPDNGLNYCLHLPVCQFWYHFSEHCLHWWQLVQTELCVSNQVHHILQC